MKFSIVTPFYNNSIEEVERVKNSILNQTYTKWEWIISDDFSTESTEHIEVLKNLPKTDKRIKYVDQKIKKELFWNPQTYATGDFVMLLSSDDEILPKTLEIFYYQFIKHPEVILITSESNIYNPNITASSFLDYTEYSNVFDKRFNFPIGWLNMGVPLTWRNIAIDFNKEFNLDNRSIITDYLIHTRLEELGKFLHIPRVFYICNVRQNSASRKIDENNDFRIHDFNKVNKIIESRRSNKEYNSALDIFNDIVYYARAFYYSDLNKEKICQNISFITKENLSYSIKNQLKEVYLDHNLFFNRIDNEIEYYVFYLTKEDDLNNFLQLFNTINNKNTHKQLVIFNYDNYNLYNEIKDTLGEFYWFTFDEMYVIIKNNNYE